MSNQSPEFPSVGQRAVLHPIAGMPPSFAALAGYECTVGPCVTVDAWEVTFDDGSKFVALTRELAPLSAERLAELSYLKAERSRPASESVDG